MQIGVLGTGTVGTTLAGKLRELGHEVRVGAAWISLFGTHASPFLNVQVLHGAARAADA